MSQSTVLSAIADNKNLPPILFAEPNEATPHIVYILTSTPIIKQYPKDFWDAYDIEQILAAELIHVGYASPSVTQSYTTKSNKNKVYLRHANPVFGLLTIARNAKKRGDEGNLILQFVANAERQYPNSFRDFVARHLHVSSRHAIKTHASARARALADEYGAKYKYGWRKHADRRFSFIKSEGPAI